MPLARFIVTLACDLIAPDYNAKAKKVQARSGLYVGLLIVAAGFAGFLPAYLLVRLSET